MQEEYSFNKNYPGGIGMTKLIVNLGQFCRLVSNSAGIRNKFRVCGNLMHVGGNGRPFWFNSGAISFSLYSFVLCCIHLQGCTQTKISRMAIKSLHIGPWKSERFVVELII